MLIRTSLSLEKSVIKTLKSISKNEKQKSLSNLVNKIIKDFTKKYEQEKKEKQLAKNYQQYAKKFNAQEFSNLESVLLSDAFKIINE